LLSYRRIFLRTIGLIGGMSWESTIPYYRQINESIKERLGGLHSAKVVLYSVDFHDIERLQHAGDWDAAGAMLAEAAISLEKAGSDFLVLCTNTMHKVAPEIVAAVSIPLLHIADPTAAEIKKAGYKSVGLLGTRFTIAAVPATQTQRPRRLKPPGADPHAKWYERDTVPSDGPRARSPLVLAWISGQAWHAKA
jgi:aspartate racemase